MLRIGKERMTWLHGTRRQGVTLGSAGPLGMQALHGGMVLSLVQEQL